MTLHRLYPSTSGPAQVTLDNDNYTMGTEFYVDSAAKLLAVYIWRPANAPGTECTVGVYQVTGGASGTLVASKNNVYLPANYNGWYRVELDAPVDLLASPAAYVAAFHSVVDNFYSTTSQYWSTGPGANGIDSGILHAPSSAETVGAGNSRFNAGVTMGYPAGGFNDSNYWVDVEIDDEVSGPPANTNPVANAGANQSVSVDTLVTLTGSGTDADGTVASYNWTQISGPSAVLNGTGNTRTFTPDEPGVYVFGLIVTDDDGATSPQDTVQITVSTGTPSHLHSIWGDAPPPGTPTMMSDGGSITAGARFTLDVNPSGGTIDAIKVFIPSQGASIPPRVRAKLWQNGGYQDPPTSEVVASITAAPGTWQTITLPTPINLSPAGAKINALVHFEDVSSIGSFGGYYVFNSNQRANGNEVESATLPGFVWAAHSSSGEEAGAIYKTPISSGSVVAASSPTVGYGVDLVINDGTNTENPDPEDIEFGSTVVSENALAGTIRQNWFDGVTSEEMPAFTRSTYYSPGDTLEMSIDYNLAFTFEVLRLGHYQGGGARSLQSGIPGVPTAQPAAVVIPNSNGAVTCESWSVNAEWTIPDNALPGWYYVLLRGSNGEDFGYAMFCVTDVADKRPMLIVTGDATWHAAYNGYGGNNVYGASKGVGDQNLRALCSTYDKPVITRDYVPQTHFLNNTYPYLKWAERMGYAVGYTTIEQIKNDPTVLDGRQIITFVGHNEYVPQVMVDKVKSLMAAGQRFVNAAGNDFFWRVKFTDGAFGSSNNGRVMWCKKDTMSGPNGTGHVAGTPFTTEADWTGTWQDTRWGLREPSEDYFGDQFVANGVRADQLQVPVEFHTSPAWRSCPDMDGSGTHTFLAGSLGMEWDRPRYGNTNVEQVALSRTIVNLTNNASDENGQNYNTSVPDAEHGITLVRNGNSYILNANSDQWSWSLDGLHLRSPGLGFTGDPNAMQMMLNVIRDLGVAPHGASVVSAGLTNPSPQSLSAYGFETGPVEHGPGFYYSGLNGEGWVKL